MIENHFRLRLPEDLADFLNDPEPRREVGRWFETIDPAKLLDARSATVWGGQMLPDSLPIVSDGKGDVLCFRINETGSVRDYIWWHHEGGGWLFAGTKLAEAIAFLPVLAEIENLHEVVASDHLSSSSASWVRCGMNLTCPLVAEIGHRGGAVLAKSVGTTWEVLREARFDTSRIPSEVGVALSHKLRVPAEQLLRQDWEAAAREATAAIKSRPDLAWPYAVAGWAAERAGKIEDALQIYEHGALRLGTSEDLAEHWDLPRTPPSAKFVARRLIALGHRPDSEEIARYLTAARARFGIRNYWMERGTAAERAGSSADAYAMYYAAGWDDSFTNDMIDVLTALQRTAAAAGFEARARIAEHHLKSLSQR